MNYSDKITVTPLLALLLLGLAIMPVTAAGSQPQPSAAFEATDCMFELPFLSFIPPESSGFECGYVTVPERHANPDGPTIRLPVAILKARGQNPRPDPLFLAQGGPGGDAFGVFSLLMPSTSIAQERDLVIFNQRGTLHAEPNLACTELFEAKEAILALPKMESLERTKEAYAACYQRLQENGVNLSAFNSLENAADVEAIRQALGYEQINFYGVSYGTLLGLHLMRDFPNHLRAVILDAVVPTHVNFIPLLPQGTDRIFTEMFNACTASSACQTEYPNLETRFFALVDQLNESPTTVQLIDSETGQTFQARLDGDILMAILFQIFYLPDAFAVFPKVVADLEQGDYGYLTEIWSLLEFDRTLSDGIYFSVICAEDADFGPDDIPLAGVRPQIARNAVEDLQTTYQEICNIWQVETLPPLVDQPVVSDVPTLLLSGRFDPITPPQNAAAAAEYLSNSYSYVHPSGSHGALGSDPCIERIIQSFLNNPTTNPNPACLTQLASSEFVPLDALRVPLLSKLNQLDAGTVIQTVVAGLFLAGILSAFVIWPLAFVVNRFRKKRPERGPIWLRLGGQGLVVLFGLLAILFVSGLTVAIGHAIGSSLINISAVTGLAAPLFVIPYVLGLIALSMLVALAALWQNSGWSVWGRLYYGFLTLCAFGYITILATTGMMSVLL